LPSFEAARKYYLGGFIFVIRVHLVGDARHLIPNDCDKNNYRRDDETENAKTDDFEKAHFVKGLRVTNLFQDFEAFRIAPLAASAL
jgi:hypothetical protein